jgi:IS30 family transposase
MAVRFSKQMIPNLIQPFWAAALAGTHRHRGLAWLSEAGGVRPRRGLDLQGRYLSFEEREELALGRAAGESIRSIALRLGRSPSTISRELARNSAPCGRYRATTAHALAPPPQMAPGSSTNQPEGTDI